MSDVVDEVGVAQQLTAPASELPSGEVPADGEAPDGFVEGFEAEGSEAEAFVSDGPPADLGSEEGLAWLQGQPVFEDAVASRVVGMLEERFQVEQQQAELQQWLDVALHPEHPAFADNVLEVLDAQRQVAQWEFEQALAPIHEAIRAEREQAEAQAQELRTATRAHEMFDAIEQEVGGAFDRAAAWERANELVVEAGGRFGSREEALQAARQAMRQAALELRVGPGDELTAARRLMGVSTVNAQALAGSGGDELSVARRHAMTKRRS